ncbi:MAG: hypothetical protein RLZZ416_778 [Candidatus Parcubacteria bacterium]|jgi:hypothetical protein
MNNLSSVLLSTLLGLVVGFASARGLLLPSWYILIPWCIAGALVGAYLGTWRLALVAGAAYGFTLSLSFLITGFSGTPEQLPSFGLLLLILGALGVVGGIVSSTIGYQLRMLFTARK